MLVRYGNDTRFTLEGLMKEDYPYSQMAAFVDTSPMLPAHPPVTRSADATIKEAEHFQSEMEKGEQ